jgi:hypothetical protein
MEDMKKIQEDANMIFDQVSQAGFSSYKEAEFYITQFWIPDMSIPRASICMALRRLEQHYPRVPRAMEA